ncbi:hypothetical protein Y032_0024g919 [Ancylostoma ceylanicum]|uniref:Uncharacterized protein n=1 Tax=Ancylostoma ceylanicum TaxID=53326 RepID=A0A016UX38_9BILA|nr:hypothetical protein Y032_0024g919 [Ancylostoma ceylanicum]
MQIRSKDSWLYPFCCLPGAYPQVMAAWALNHKFLEPRLDVDCGKVIREKGDNKLNVGQIQLRAHGASGRGLPEL